jgi:hypothetical protein
VLGRRDAPLRFRDPECFKGHGVHAQEPEQSEHRLQNGDGQGLGSAIEKCCREIRELICKNPLSGGRIICSKLPVVSRQCVSTDTGFRGQIMKGFE